MFSAEGNLFSEADKSFLFQLLYKKKTSRRCLNQVGKISLTASQFSWCQKPFSWCFLVISGRHTVACIIMYHGCTILLLFSAVIFKY